MFSARYRTVRSPRKCRCSVIGSRAVVAASDGNWIQTEALTETRVRLTVVRDGKVIHSEELEGADPSGMRAYEAAIDWAAIHCPDVVFDWKHRTHTPPRGVKP